MLDSMQNNEPELKTNPNKSNRPNTMETILFVIALLQRIPRHKPITASQLQKQLDDAGIVRELRTIQRQLEMLSQSPELGIECDQRSKPYGYRWVKDSKGLALPILSRQESLLLVLAQRQLANLLPANLMKSMDSFFDQANKNLSDVDDINLKESKWLTKVRAVSETQPLIAPPILTGIFDAVSNALYHNQFLTIEYKNSYGKETVAEIMPLALAQQGTRLYLVCRFKGYDDERSLALHRILAAKASTLTFERPVDFDLQKYDENGRFNFGDGQWITLNFIVHKSHGSHLLEYKLSKDQTVKDLGDELEIIATVVDSAQLDWWLNGFGDGIRDISKRLINPDRDPLYEEVLPFILAKKKVSPSHISRNFKITWQRAALIIEEIESLGIVSKISSNGKRTLLVS